MQVSERHAAVMLTLVAMLFAVLLGQLSLVGGDDTSSCAAEQRDASSFYAQIQLADKGGAGADDQRLQEQQQRLAEWLVTVTRGQNYTVDIHEVVRADRRIRKPPVSDCQCNASTGSGCHGALRIRGGVSENLRPGLPSGFGALYFLHTLNGLMHAERQCLAPVVEFAPENSRAYHDPAGRGSNSWLYYYEPIGSSATAAMEAEEFSDWEILLAEYREPWSMHVPWRGHWQETTPAAIAHAERLVAQMYKVKTNIASRVAEEWVALRHQLLPGSETAVDAAAVAAGLLQPILGLHIRGTDAPLLDGRTADTAEMALPFAEQWLEETKGNGGKIYLATDSVEVFTAVTAVWPEHVRARVITRKEVGRGAGSDSIFGDRAAKGVYREGLDALVDLQLLAKCDFLVHSRSTFTEGALLSAGPRLRRRSCLLSDPVPTHFL